MFRNRSKLAPVLDDPDGLPDLAADECWCGAPTVVSEPYSASLDEWDWEQLADVTCTGCGDVWVVTA